MLYLYEQFRLKSAQSTIKDIHVPTFVTTKPAWQIYPALLKKCKKFKHIVVVGNGGSINNILALYHAFKDRCKKQLHVVKSTDPAGTFMAVQKLPKAQTLVIAISKSGTTANVIAETAELAKKFPVFVITAENDAPLHQFARKNKTLFFPHPDVGGRFTANQDNTLLPFAILADSIPLAKALSAGMEKAYKNTVMAKRIAMRLYQAEQSGYREVYMPVYCEALHGVGTLLRQLNHETYCKNKKGLTFLITSGPECQHHSNQRFFGGRKDMVLLSLRVKYAQSFGTFLNLEHQGVFDHAVQQNIPSLCLTLDKLTPENIGCLIGVWQYAVVYSAYLRSVNPFDQPEVEASKALTKKYLKNPPKKDALTEQASMRL